MGSGTSRTWFRSKVQGENGRQIVLNKRSFALDGKKPLPPGSIAEFIESVWWPRVKAKVTVSTLRDYRSILELHIEPFYLRDIQSIRLEELQPWVNSFTCSPKRIRNIYGVMSSILQLAKLTDRYPSNDHKLVILPEYSKRHEKPDIGLANIEKLLEASRGTPMEGPIWAASYLGLRRNEVCGLKRAHVQIKGDTAEVGVQHNRQSHGETAKLKSKPLGHVRKIYVPAELGKKLLSYGHPDQLYLFLARDGTPINPNRITKSMADLCAKAGVPRMDFKTLRAACRSNLSALGVSQDTIMDILGHSTLSTSMIYQDNRPDRQSAAISKLLSRGDTGTGKRGDN